MGGLVLVPFTHPFFSQASASHSLSSTSHQIKIALSGSHSSSGLNYGSDGSAYRGPPVASLFPLTFGADTLLGTASSHGGQVGILRDDGPGLIGVGFMSETMVPRMELSRRGR
jgi:hypothetical protein